ncbi:eggshell protein 2A [Sesamum indicum]|uniref:Eggshell protein 2A n=1 Tax=Sesamum indicum TaxID=4182 RepID=A0A6I9U9R6_SESIN|nr:eggshell protein 2A [Sesamum indicum]
MPSTVLYSLSTSIHFSFSLFLNAFSHPISSLLILLSSPLIQTNHNMTSSLLTFLFSFFLISATLSLATRPQPDAGPGGFLGPGGGFNIPGFGPGFGGGYGSGYGGPSGGHSKHGIIRTSFVCSEKGPCYKKKLTCPARCFSSYGRSGKGYGYGGGGGGCTMDCKKKCTAYC